MVYAYDQWLPMPTKDLFDTLMMLASVNAAKDMYEKGLEEMKEFNKEYGDFYSPIAKDMLWTNDYVLLPMRDAINSMYEAGIDPLRSKEGRGLLAQLRAKIDTGRMARNKASAINATEYLKSISKLGPLYNPDYEEFVLNGNTLDNFSSEDGIWMNTAASPYSTLQELVHPSFLGIKPHMLSKEDVESRGYAYNPLYDYEGITRKDMEAVMGTLMPGVRNDKRFLYHRELARRDLLAENGGIEPTEQQIDERLVNNAIQSDSQIMTPLTYDANKYALELVKLNNEIYANRLHEIDKARYNGNVGGSGSQKGAPSIFREADANLEYSTAEASNGAEVAYLTGKGAHVGYDRFLGEYYQWMDPVGNGIRLEENKNGGYAFWIPKRSLDTIYLSEESRYGANKRSVEDSPLFANSDCYFVPVGQIHTELVDGQKRYFITGTLTDGMKRDAEKNRKYITDSNGNQVLFDLEVKERAFNYGKKQLGVNAPSN